MSKVAVHVLLLHDVCMCWEGERERERNKAEVRMRLIVLFCARESKKCIAAFNEEKKKEFSVRNFY